MTAFLSNRHELYAFAGKQGFVPSLHSGFLADVKLGLDEFTVFVLQGSARCSVVSVGIRGLMSLPALLLGQRSAYYAQLEACGHDLEVTP